VTRSFIPTAAGLRGIRLVAPGLVELHQRMLSRLSEEDARRTELMRQLQRERLAVVQGG
jgi:hypothetical protein